MINLSGFAQLEKFKLITSISGEYNMISIDEIGNLYSVEGNMIKKYNQDGKTLSNYSNFLAGDISFIDTRDPFKLLIYYQEFSQIEILDNTLSPVNKIDLSALGYDLTSLACASYQNGFWIFIPQFSELIRFNQYLEITDRTGNLYKATGMEVNPNYMLERDNVLYLNNPAFGIMVFDRYGSYFRTIAIKELSNFQVLNKMLVLKNSSEIKIIDPKNLEENIIKLPEEKVLQAKLLYSDKEKRLFTLNSNEIRIYSIK